MIFSAQPRPIVHAVVSDLAGLLFATTLTRRGDLVTLRDAPLFEPDEAEAVAHLAEWLAAGGDRDPDGVNPLDAGITIHSVLGAAVPRPSGWRLRAAGDYYRPEAPALVVVAPIGVPSRLTVEALRGGGVSVVVRSGGEEPPHDALECRSAAELAAQLPHIVAATRRALATR